MPWWGWTIIIAFIGFCIWGWSSDNAKNIKTTDPKTGNEIRKSRKEIIKEATEMLCVHFDGVTTKVELTKIYDALIAEVHAWPDVHKSVKDEVIAGVIAKYTIKKMCMESEQKNNNKTIPTMPPRTRTPQKVDNNLFRDCSTLALLDVEYNKIKRQVLRGTLKTITISQVNSDYSKRKQELS